MSSEHGEAASGDDDCSMQTVSGRVAAPPPTGGREAPPPLSGRRRQLLQVTAVRG
jgi:hypothetical protein